MQKQSLVTNWFVTKLCPQCNRYNSYTITLRRCGRCCTIIRLSSFTARTMWIYHMTPNLLCNLPTTLLIWYMTLPHKLVWLFLNIKHCMLHFSTRMLIRTWRNIKCDNYRTVNKTLVMMILGPLRTDWMIKQYKNWFRANKYNTHNFRWFGNLPTST